MSDEELMCLLPHIHTCSGYAACTVCIGLKLASRVKALQVKCYGLGIALNHTRKDGEADLVSANKRIEGLEKNYQYMTSEMKTWKKNYYTESEINVAVLDLLDRAKDMIMGAEDANIRADWLTAFDKIKTKYSPPTNPAKKKGEASE